jgi:hypothetical protein
MEAEFIGMSNDAVVLQGPNGKNFELPLTSFSPADQLYIKSLDRKIRETSAATGPAKPILSRSDYQTRSVETLTQQVISLSGGAELHITGTGDPIAGSSFLFSASDGWLFFDRIAPSEVASRFINRMWARGAKAVMDENLRVVQYGSGTVVIPQAADFEAMTVFDEKSQTGTATPLKCYEAYSDAPPPTLKKPVGSLTLRRGDAGRKTERNRYQQKTTSRRITIW